MLDAVEERDDGRDADVFWRGERQGRFELRRLDCHPQRIDLPVEMRRRRYLDLEVAEHGALDGETTVVAVDRLAAHQQDDIGAGPCERGRKQTADPARSQNRMLNTSQFTPASANARGDLLLERAGLRGDARSRLSARVGRG